MKRLAYFMAAALILMSTLTGCSNSKTGSTNNGGMNGTTGTPTSYSGTGTGSNYGTGTGTGYGTGSNGMTNSTRSNTGTNSTTNSSGMGNYGGYTNNANKLTADM